MVDLNESVLAELKAIRAAVESLASVVDEFLPMARKAAAIKAMSPAAQIRKAMNKRGNSRLIASGTDGSGETRESATRRILPDPRSGRTEESD